jgi:integrase
MPSYKKYDPKLREKNGRYYLRFYDPATKRRPDIPLGTTSKNVAKRKAAAMTNDYYNGKYNPFARDTYQFGALSLRRAVNRYMKDKQHNRPATLRSMGSLLGLLIKECPSGIAIDHVNPKDIQRVIDRCASAAGKGAYHRQLRAFFSHMENEGLLKASPMREVRKPRRPDKTFVYLRPEDLSTLLDAQETTDMKLRVRFMIATGGRRGEICALTWRQIRRDAGRIYIEASEGFNTKTGEHVVPLLPYADAVLTEIEQNHMEQFGTLPPLSLRVFVPEAPSTVSNRFKRAVRAAGLSEDYNMKALRHTFASWAVIAGVDLYRVSKWLGHTSIKTTEIYAHLAPEYGVTMDVPREIWNVFGEIMGNRTTEQPAKLRRVK